MRKSEARLASRWKLRRIADRVEFRVAVLMVSLAASFGASGCHSAYVNATVSNRSASTISLVQVEYPSASFGTQSIAPGQDFKYRFKVLGSGNMKITYTDTAQVEHKFTGPELKEGNEGSLGIVVGDGKLGWNLSLASQ